MPLIGCQPVKPLPPAVRQHELAGASRSRPRPPTVLYAHWSFAIAETACVARASHRDLSLTVRIGDKNQAEFILAAAALRSGAIRRGMNGVMWFNGEDGEWRFPARADGHGELIAVRPLNQSAENDILTLLDGGTLRAEVRETEIPGLRIPAANVSGRDWFGCVRSKLSHSS